jgi:gliding motility-associated lipoprotein GldH
MFEKNTPVPIDGWTYEEGQTFTVNISDTTQAYNLYINIRHTTEYNYNNIWILLTTTLPDGNILTDQIELQLAEPTGEWTGNCLDGICFNSILARSNFRFFLPGEHQFTIAQDMRVSPLQGISDVGVRLEKLSI